MILRTAFWFFVWCLFLGFADIDVEYKDGLHLKFFSHATRRRRKKEKADGK